METLLKKIRACTVCEIFFDHPARPILSADSKSKLVIIGQAPGRIVHETGIPWNDKSGDTLREWLGIDKKTFYNPKQIAIIPMGFCYPGKGKNGDLPPRPECAPLWHKALLDQMKAVELTILIGSYAQSYYLREKSKATLTQTVQSYAAYLPGYFPLPHPSPRNNIWQSKNPWFKSEVLPVLRKTVKKILES